MYERHIDTLSVWEKFPYLKTHIENGKLYIGIDVERTGLSLDYKTICYVISKVYDYIVHYCWDGRVYNIRNENHLIVISSKF